MVWYVNYISFFFFTLFIIIIIFNFSELHFN